MSSYLLIVMDPFLDLSLIFSGARLHMIDEYSDIGRVCLRINLIHTPSTGPRTRSCDGVNVFRWRIMHLIFSYFSRFSMIP
jgi:hypothetical protein